MLTESAHLCQPTPRAPGGPSKCLWEVRASQSCSFCACSCSPPERQQNRQDSPRDLNQRKPARRYMFILRCVVVMQLVVVPLSPPPPPDFLGGLALHKGLPKPGPSKPTFCRKQALKLPPQRETNQMLPKVSPPPRAFLQAQLVGACGHR